MFHGIIIWNLLTIDELRRGYTRHNFILPSAKVVHDGYN